MSVSLETLERIKAQLKQARDQGSTVKLDLYTHLTEVFNRIMLHHPYDAYDKFEEISHLVKQTHLKIKDPKTDFEVNSIQHKKSQPEKEAWISKCQALLKEVSIASQVELLLKGMNGSSLKLTFKILSNYNCIFT